MVNIERNPVYTALATAEKFVEMVYRGELPAAVICGPPGVGKTHTGAKVAQRHGHPWRPERPGSARGLLNVIYRHRHGGVVPFDEMDGIFDNRDGVNILKVAADNKACRMLSYSVGGGRSVNPFEVKCGLTFFTNRNFDNARDFNAKVFRTDLPAIKERSAVIAIPFDPMALYEYCAWLATEGGMLKAIYRQSVGRNLNISEANEVLEHFWTYAARYPSISPRMLVKFATWRVGADRSDWLQLVESQLLDPAKARKLPPLEQFFIVAKRDRHNHNNVKIAENAPSIPVDDSEPATKPVKRHYWVTPRELYRKWDDEWHFDFDACPHPRPDGFDSLTMEDWPGKSCFCNPPFTVGISAWVKKAIAEYQKGKLVVVVMPFYQDRACGRLYDAGAEVRPIGGVRWLSLEDGSRNPAKAADLVMCGLFILDPARSPALAAERAAERAAQDAPVPADEPDTNVVEMADWTNGGDPFRGD